MRFPAAAAVPLLLAACSSALPSGAGKLTLNDPYWDRVNVEVVVTKGDCSDSGKEIVSRRKLVMTKDSTESFVVPDGANLCWRHDPNPNKPVAGLWSDWTKATLMPGQRAETDL